MNISTNYGQWSQSTPPLIFQSRYLPHSIRGQCCTLSHRALNILIKEAFLNTFITSYEEPCLRLVSTRKLINRKTWSILAITIKKSSSSICSLFQIPASVDSYVSRVLWIINLWVFFNGGIFRASVELEMLNPVSLSIDTVSSAEYY